MNSTVGGGEFIELGNSCLRAREGERSKSQEVNEGEEEQQGKPGGYIWYVVRKKRSIYRRVCGSREASDLFCS